MYEFFWFVFYSGRLYQVEYAMEAICHAGTCLGIRTTEGVIASRRKEEY